MSSPDFPSNQTVASWLESLGLSQYIETFQANNITPELLARLNDSELRELGISSLGHRKTILLAISHLKKTGRTAYIPPPDAPAPSVGFELPGEPEFPGAQGESIPVSDLPVPDSLRQAAPQPIPAGRPPDAPATEKERPWWRPRLVGKFLYISIAVHLLFAIGATYFIVQTIEAKRKLTFQAGPKSPNPSQRSIEHKVSLAKKQNTMSAPVQPKRITTTGSSKIALPDMPSLPKTSDFTPGKLAGMGGTGIGPGFGGGGGGGGMGGPGMTMFGFRNAGSGGIRGEFYDLKQTADKTPSGMDLPGFVPAVTSVVKKGFDPKELAKFFKAPNPLFAGQIFIPDILADEGPKAFGVEQLVAPKMWVVLYRGKVVAPETGQYRFVGIGDDILVVKFKDRIVLDHGSYSISGWKPKKFYSYDPSWLLPGGAREWYGIVHGHAVGDEFQVDAGRSYDIEVLIAEHPGGAFTAQLLIEKVGTKYEKDAQGNPILPIFRMAKTKNPDPAGFPPFLPDGPIWQGSSENPSGLNR